ncbi:MAG TPA: 1-acyl-sn-glycerol-3-phosphate acyltransferase, partial [Saprospiraceae bacterium]|nr:1-acyl-sn-glycerol-3-phosphate acyltransferase [Saprospiraceae bacterium]
PWKVDPQDEKVYWQNISKELESSLNKPEKAEIQDALFKKIINRYNEEIVAHFSPGIFKFSRWFLTAFFKRLLSRYFAKGQWRWGTKSDLQQRIKIVGDIEKLRMLFEKGNVVIMPTHYSNLDSVMIGYAMDTNVGLPFFSYGAGLNLYNVEIVGYFINRLGAFRVDRRKKNPIYLECLKSMASYSIMDDVNCLFFPGGTRSRSGKTEDKLKLGLIGSVIEAQRLLLEKNEEKKVFVVPLNIGYHFVLEAGQLIDQHLQAIGRDKYKRTRQSGPTFSTIMRFVRDLYRKESEVYMSFGEPIDILGNSVDINGDSYDKFGNKIDLKDYFSLGGELSSNLQRESIYSKYLGEVVSESYKKYNVILSSNVVSFVAFHLIFEEYKNLELIPFINQSGKTFTIEGSDFEQNVDKLVQIIQNLSTDKHVTVSDESWSDVPVLIEEG